jgi:hypothetical protein
MVKVKGK